MDIKKREEVEGEEEMKKYEAKARRRMVWVASKSY